MNIIRSTREDPLSQIEMTCLLLDWGIRRCNVSGCKTKPTTIIGGVDGLPHPIGLCEEHFQHANQPSGPVTYTFEWDSFDAFKPATTYEVYER